ncbi:hypothetical protein HNR03_000536 [Pseudomonas sp. JAI111]|uniref:hypothetical protein n=1 Tax=Pseudomonas sp. JAI111 TaxID=2735913 RepID=UPI00216A94D2|nr:hypothetical protein [Pseudomonas sp. JAI111]MCS3835956.1 hypothetical protein [Pseudomonas sp. JAI111]
MASQEQQACVSVEVVDNLILGYVMKKLTDVFEALMEVSRQHHPDNMQGLLQMGSVKGAALIPFWLKRVESSAPIQVSHVLIEQMNDAQTFKQDPRFQAQIVLFDALVEASLAMDIERYSQLDKEAPLP